MAVLRGGSTPSSPTDPADQGAAVARQHPAGAEQLCLQTAGASGVPRARWDLLAGVLIT